MKPLLPLFLMVDACGWEIIKNDPFARRVAPYRRRLSSVFGYSSTCIPTILSGRWPDQHRNWCYFVYDPAHSPFKKVRPLRWLPKPMTSRRIFRRWLGRFLKRPLNLRGYFDLYNIPFEYIDLFDFTEKKNPLQPRGLNCGPNIFDYLEDKRIPYFVSDPERSERENLQALIGEVEQEQIEFAFLYWPGLDGLLHQHGNDSPKVGLKLREYELWIDELLGSTRRHYAEVRLYLFSDHGMANCDRQLDLQRIIHELGLHMPRDYAAVYDSTMARFWFFNSEARRKISARLQQLPEGRILSDDELASLRTLFVDRYFGELIFLVEEGVLIVPSHMGERPIRAMHGYHPSAPHSYAALLSNRPDIPHHIQALPDLFELMTEEAEHARAARLTHVPAATFVDPPECPLTTPPTGVPRI